VFFLGRVPGSGAAGRGENQ